MRELQGLEIRLTKLESGVFKPRKPRGVMEFHISRQAREYYDFDENLFSLTGNVILPNFLAVRVFAKKMNDKRDLLTHPEQAILPGQLNAMGLIDEILHYVAEVYREERGTTLFAQALKTTEDRLGKDKVDQLLKVFVDSFPGLDVYKGKTTTEAYLAGSTDGVSHRELAMEEIILLWLANMNPAFNPWKELFDDGPLGKTTVYPQFISVLHDFFDTAPHFGPDNQNLLDMLRSPALAVPDSLHGQLNYIKEKWGMLLGKFLRRLLSSLDFMKEEERLFWKGGFTKSEGYDSSLSFTGAEHEPEAFSADKEWMPRVILLAKSTLVWLDQLSKKYGRDIRRLDQIPDEELDIMARRGFNALWFIGLWERSKASKKIKQMCGNPEAEASAYSLYDYEIAWELGGWEALNNLRERAWRRGIRIASDMVPNHTAMDSNWISQHPDYFLQLDYCPFPNYSFNGPDLSQDPNIEVKLEDHYYDRSDASVVFLHRDKRTNRHRYIYHGNDGTSMPWNDTAQINYLNPEAREAIIQIILNVARNFPIIRFDAAMTLAKKHIQRLWYPVPGSGGDIATRAEHALSNEEFNRLLPVEFWREVVDRVATEVPDTLLLAEAFWMMEGYFVRTLGMHRVYNSAFMHMFKKEENEKYRYTIKNTLEFDPEILKRYVNFMNNPDEETAAVQFGGGDKYFGVMTMMVTMPGTPMIGHGQVEGFREKYGMEYRRAYWNETEDQDLIRRHEREVFPLMHKRYLFAEVRNFYLFDLWNPHGMVNQNVFAYSNQAGNEHALVLYNNSYERAVGWLRSSAGFAVKKPDGTKTIQQRDLASALGLTNAADRYVLLREHNAGLWFIRKSQDIFSSGLYVELNGYGKQVFLDIHEVADNDQGHMGKLHYELGGRGVEDIEEALKESLMRPLYQSFGDLVNHDTLRSLYEVMKGHRVADPAFWKSLEEKSVAFAARTRDFSGGQGDPETVGKALLRTMKAAASFGQAPAVLKNHKVAGPAMEYYSAKFLENQKATYGYAALSMLCGLGKAVDDRNNGAVTRSLMDDWFLDRKIRRIFTGLEITEGDAHHLVHMVKVMVGHSDWAQVKGGEKNKPATQLKNLLLDREIQEIMGTNRYEGILYFNKEGFEYLCSWLFGLGIITAFSQSEDIKTVAQEIADLHQTLDTWSQAALKSGYEVEKWLDILDPSAKAEKPKAEVKPKAKK